MENENEEKWYELPGTDQVVSEKELRGRGVDPSKEGFKPVEFQQLSGKVPLKVIEVLRKAMNPN